MSGAYDGAMMNRLLVIPLLLSGCAAILDPAHHGTAAMQRAWAYAEACEQDPRCQVAPGEQVLVKREGDWCLCVEDVPNYGASYYAEPHAPRKDGSWNRFKLATPLEVMADLEAAAKANLEAAKACAAKWREKKAATP